MSDLKQRFEDAVSFVQSATGNFKPSNETKLEFYAFYKQATEGDATGSRPSFTDMVARAKWDAWNAHKGKSADQAMQAYIDLIDSLS